MWKHLISRFRSNFKFMHWNERTSALWVLDILQKGPLRQKIFGTLTTPTATIIGVSQKNWAVPGHAHAPFFPKFLMGVSSDVAWHVIVSAKFEVRIFTCSWVNRGSQKLERVPGYARILYLLRKSYICLAYRLFSYVHFFPRFLIAVLSGRCEPPILGREGEAVGGRGWLPFERALVRSYRPSVVTFPPSLRVWEILPLLFSRTPLFPTPHLFSPKFPHVPL